ncbi:hypothetical protein [Geodermatophilus sp. URMC 64]
MDAQRTVVTLRVTTGAPLQRRGLVRAATAAGFTVVPPGAAAAVTLSMREDGGADGLAAGEPGLDISVGEKAVVLTVRRPPDLATVLLVRSLLTELLGSG